MKTLLELFEEYKSNDSSMSDLHLDCMTNESGDITNEVFRHCPLYYFLEELSSNADISRAKKKETDPVLEIRYHTYIWADYQGNGIRVILQYDYSDAINEKVYEGYSVEYIRSEEVYAKEETFSRN